MYQLFIRPLYNINLGLESWNHPKRSNIKYFGINHSLGVADASILRDF